MRTGEQRARQVEATRRWRERHPGAQAAASAKWRERHPERVAMHKRNAVMRRYGITVEQYEFMLAAQGGLCGICRKPPGRRRLAVDHDHETGEVRMLLCDRCNMAVGIIEDPMFNRWVEYIGLHYAARTRVA